MKPTLVLMCGLPGSGKTTLARKLAGEIPAVRLCTDEWQAALKVDLRERDHDSERFHDLLEDQLWVFGQELLRLGQSVIFEKGLWRRDERDEKRREALQLGADIEFHYLDVPVGELRRRLRIRRAENRPWTPTGFVDTTSSGTMVYEERTGRGTGAQEVHPGI